MQAKKTIGVIMGLFMTSVLVVAKSSLGECCVFCGDCAYTPPSTTTHTTVTTTTTGCVFCGEGSVTYSTSTKTTTIYRDFSKAQVLYGQFTDGSGSVGSVTLKVGKISKKGTVKVSAKLASAKKTYSASATVDADASSGTASGTLTFSSKNVGSMRFGIAYDESAGMTFEGESVNGYVMSSYEVDESDNGDDDIDDDSGGVLGSVLGFSVDGGELEAPENYDFVGDLPSGEPVYNSNGKWKTDSAPSVKYKKVDGEYELVYDEEKTNFSDLKLSYKAKKGTFSGSFKIYASNEGSTEKKPKLKTYKAKVSGVITGSSGRGTATVKIGKVKYSLPVTIETVE